MSKLKVKSAADFGLAVKMLESIRSGLGRELAAGIREDAQPLLAEAKALTPRGPGPRPTADPDSDDALPHIADTLSVQARGGTLAIVSSHPGAAVHEWGGTIRPNGAPITFAAAAMAQRALASELPAIEAAVDARIDALIARNS